MPKALVLDDDTPKRRASSRSTGLDATQGRGLLLSLVLRNPKDVIAGSVATIAVVAIIANATFMQAGRHPAPMFSAVFSSAPTPAPHSVAPAIVSPLPRPRPSEAEIRPQANAADATLQIVRGVPPQAGQQPATVSRPPASVQPHSDPVGDLIISTRRITTVQRLLTEFGYGQLRATGVVGADTRVAIEKFERERKLPVTGQINDRLVHELAAVTGRAID